MDWSFGVMENRNIGILSLHVEPIIQHFITPLLHYPFIESQPFSDDHGLFYSRFRRPGIIRHYRISC